jgi:RND family efflux transporter MFP subunit
MSEPEEELPRPGSDSKRVQGVIVVGAGVVLLAVVGLYLRAAARTNHDALDQGPKPVTVSTAHPGTFRPLRTYVGTTNAWNTARVGPQYISAYVGTVLVRPGAEVKRGQVLATLDCRNASAASKETAARAKALEERQLAVEHESQRTKELTEGGFASANEVEQLAARSASQKSEVESLRASLVSRGLEVDDCVLRAPFNGEVADRFADPGAYVRPGNPVVTVLDRSMVRISADAPESDFAIVAPGTPVDIEVDATSSRTQATISRRAPGADEVTRTVHFEIDVQNATHALPAGTTARLSIRVGEPRPATLVPLRAAILRSDKASLFVVEAGVAKHTIFSILGEQAGTLYLEPKLPAGAQVVVEGRALLDDNDKVTARELAP